MSKTSTELVRHALSGPTMGTRWTALFFADPAMAPTPIQTALQAAVDAVDRQMSTWNPESDLMRLNAAPIGEWIDVPAMLMEVLSQGLRIGKASAGAFDIGMGDAVSAWGFGPLAADATRINKALQSPRIPAHQSIEIDQKACRVLKRTDIAIDLNGIAKGFGADRLADILTEFGIGGALVGIDGEMRAIGLRPDALPWSVAVEAPHPDRREAHAVLVLEDAAVATSGDYRHWVDIGDRRLSHTMHPEKGAPLAASPASVTVVAQTCAEADAWATAMMVLGVSRGQALAQALGLNALFLLRETDGTIAEHGTGRLFEQSRPVETHAANG